MKLIPVFLLLALFSSCASQTKKEVNEKVSQEKTTDFPALKKTIHEVIASSNTLTETQKSELNKILNDLKNQNKVLVEEAIKLRAVLLKELLSGKANQREVRLLKKKIKSNESVRIQNTLQTFDKISKIAATQPNKDEFVEPMLYIEHSIR